MTTVSSVAEFVQQITELDHSLIRDGGPNNETLLFRGQSNKAYDLLPSIARKQKFACDISIFSEERNMIEMAKYKLPNVFNDSLSPLSLLSIIADIKENVIFAMEEPEIALPPHIQKRVISTVIEKSTQALFTSHSPYVIEEFPPDQILVISKTNGDLTAAPAGMPPTVKMKAYREEMRRRFCESLLARRVLIVEGRTEYDVYSTAAKKLQRLHPERNCSFDLLGIALVQANTDTQVAPLGEYYKKMGKTVYAIFDKQDDDVRKKIEVAVDYMYEATEHGIEDVVLKDLLTKVK